MKKRLIGLSLLLATVVSAQDKDWFNYDKEKNNIYGVNTDKAYKFLQETGRKPKPIIVGILDSGVDAEHEDLVNVMWKNPKEIPHNKQDDDNNGYADDVHGWNFIGNAKGENVDHDNMEITRLYAQYKPMFEDATSKKIKKNIRKSPEVYKTYEEAKHKVTEGLVKAEQNKRKYESIQQDFSQAFDEVEKVFGHQPINEEIVMEKVKTQSFSSPRVAMVLSIISEQAAETQTKTITVDQARKQLDDEISGAINHYDNQIKYQYNTTLDTRKIVGDDYSNLNEKHYGNNDVEGPDALHGTHVAGLVGAQRNNGIGMNGIADHVQIMSVRVVPDGDERDKDVANGIIYAVDNGAKLLNMSFGKSYSPQKEAVDKALEYAASKGALLIHAAGNDAKDLDGQHNNYPTNVDVKQDTIAKNWITIGASTETADQNLPAPFSNYGAKSVDLFSPGVNIYSTVPNNKYKFLQGTSMAAPIATGVAALIWTYYPELTAYELRKILLESVNTYTGKVKLPNESDDIKQDRPFASLSTTGGVIDAYKAAVLAEKYTKTKK